MWATVGPAFAAARVEGKWTSAAGGELSLLHVTERALPAALGISIGALGYVEREGGRVWLEAEAALRDPLPFGLGFSVGATAEVDVVEPARWGGQTTVWAFAGVIPYVRAGWVEVSGAFLEAGLLVKVPVLRLH